MIVSALFLAAMANAKDLAPAGKATVVGVVEIPLYSAPAAGDLGWFVEGTINNKPVLLQLATEQVGLQLSAAAAARVGVKPAGKEGAQTARVGALSLGSVSLTGINAEIGGGGTGIDGKIGLASWTGLAWAVLPSAGVVKLGPAGAQSVASEVAADVGYGSTPGAKRRVGTAQREFQPMPLSMTALVSGVELRVVVASGTERSRVATEVDGGADWFSLAGQAPEPVTPLPAFDGALRGDVEVEWREVTLGGGSAWTRVDRTGSGLSFPYATPGLLGFEALQHFDLGVDPERRAITLRPNQGNSAKSYGPVYVARLEAALVEPAAPDADVNAARKALAGKLSPLVAAYTAVADYEKAVGAARQWTEAAPERCTSWHALGQAKLAAGDPAGAVEPLRKAAALYQPWAVRPLAERKELESTEDKRSAKADFDGVYAQPHSCFTAWGDAATALVASGQGAGVAELYPSQLDLDTKLPRAAGTASLVSGNPAAAEAAFRQAVKLSYTTDELARAGMMLATRSRSADLALAQFASNPDSTIHSLGYFLLYTDVLREARGQDGAVAAMMAYLAKTPWSAAGWLALANLQGAEPGAASVAKAQALLDAQLPWSNQRADLHALQAEAHRLAGRLPEAAASADHALTLDAALAEAYLVRARVAESAGDADRAAELRARAFTLAASDPRYAPVVAANPG